MNEAELNKLTSIYNGETSSIKEAFKIQKDLSKKIIREKTYDQLRTVAGADLAILTKQEKFLCGIVVFSYPSMQIVEKVYSITEIKFPYIPGLLAFRECPAIIETFEKIRNKPDLLMIDGHGLAHPRSFGIACHAGVILGIPTIGVAKKKLFGTYIEPQKQKGNWSKLKNKKDSKTIGAVVRTKNNVKPVFVSIGNKIDLQSSVKLVLDCSVGYRIPEPTRQADKFVSELKLKPTIV